MSLYLWKHKNMFYSDLMYAIFFAHFQISVVASKYNTPVIIVKFTIEIK